MIRLIPTTTELLTKGLIDIYLKQIWKLHGIPKKITSDRGPQFASELMKELCTQLGIQQNLSTAYHPQTDSQVECSHQETETFLCHYVNHLQDDWEDWLAISTTIKYTQVLDICRFTLIMDDTLGKANPIITLEVMTMSPIS